MTLTQEITKLRANRVGIKRRRGRPRRNTDLGPTPETLAKLMPDVLLSLLDGEFITAEQESAARELSYMWRALQRGMLPQMKLGISSPTPGRKQARSPFARMKDSEIEVWRARYKPWAVSESKAVVVNAPRLLRLDLTRNIVENNSDPKIIAHEFGVHTDGLLDEFRDSLDSYCAFRRVKKLLT